MPPGKAGEPGLLLIKLLDCWKVCLFVRDVSSDVQSHATNLKQEDPFAAALALIYSNAYCYLSPSLEVSNSLTEFSDPNLEASTDHNWTELILLNPDIT